MQTSIPGRAAGHFRHGLAFALIFACMHVSGSTGADTSDQAIDLALDTARRHASETQTPANRNEAIRAYREAAKLGNSEAKLELARMLLRLVHDPPDDVDPRGPSRYFRGARVVSRGSSRGDAAVKYEFASLSIREADRRDSNTRPASRGGELVMVAPNLTAR